jgi:hypothetical protein
MGGMLWQKERCESSHCPPRIEFPQSQLSEPYESRSIADLAKTHANSDEDVGSYCMALILEQEWKNEGWKNCQTEEWREDKRRKLKMATLKTHQSLKLYIGCQ